MDGERVSISDVAVDEYASDVEQLFRDYHRWNKEQVKEALSGGPVSTAEIEREYDPEEIISDDVRYLRDPSSGGHLCIAHQDDRVIGCVYLKRVSDSSAEVRRLYVRPSARGEGIGRRLMETLVEIATDEHYERLLLNTGPHTEAAQSLYAALGFEETEPYESEIPESAHDHWNFMELALEPA